MKESIYLEIEENQNCEYMPLLVYESHSSPDTINKLNLEFIGRGGAWLDAGSPKDLFDASQFVATIEERQGFKIACLEEIAWRKGIINSEQLVRLASDIGDNQYGNYLKSLPE